MPHDEQRHHFPMKGGLQADHKSDEGVNEALYGASRLDSALRKRLQEGFGERLRDAFRDQGIETHDLIRDGSFEELNKAVVELLGWMK